MRQSTCRFDRFGSVNLSLTASSTWLRSLIRLLSQLRRSILCQGLCLSRNCDWIYLGSLDFSTSNHGSSHHHLEYLGIMDSITNVMSRL